MKRYFLIAAKFLGGIIVIILLYFASTLILSNISVNSDFKPAQKDSIEIHILSNGVHTDLVLPLKHPYKDWTTFVDPKNTQGQDSNKLNVAFGWGDKGFYLETKTWNDLKFSTAFKAAFYMSTSAMHVSYYNKLKERDLCKKVVISKESYLKLVDHIVNSFKKDENGKAIQIKNAYYGDNDSFYEAEGSYSLFYTCNTWTNEGLKAAGLKARLWTPYQGNIMELYESF